MNTVTAIVPAYNEGDRIASVLKTLLSCSEVSEIIVVDDCSTDATRAKANVDPKVIVLYHEKNLGKTQALRTGFVRATGSHILFVDADLVGLTARHITDLITPVITGAVDMTISLRENAPRIWRRIGIDYLSGERVFEKALLAPYIDQLPKLPKFGFEVFFNSIIIKKDLRIRIVMWSGVHSPFKIHKYGYWSGIWRDIMMGVDIMRVISPFTMIRQIITMRRMSRKV